MQTRRSKGVKVGFEHDWHYNDNRLVERKIAPRVWKIYQGQSKSRNTKAPRGSGAPIGSKFVWGWNTVQVMKKVTPNKYIGYMKGTKKLIKAKIPKYRAVKRKRLTKR